MHIVVVGGGISGLATAYRLRQLCRADTQITVIEQEHQLGGKLRTVELAGQPYDVGAEAFLLRQPAAIALIKDLGLAESLVYPTSARAGIRAAGHSRPIPGNTLMGVPRSPAAVAEVLSTPGIRRVSAERELPALSLNGTDVAVGTLLRERLGSELVDRLVDPLLGGVYAGQADNLGLRATMPALANALDNGYGSILAAAQSLISAPDPHEPRPPVFGTLHNGFQSLTDHLVTASGAQIRLRSPVRALHQRSAGWQLEIGSAPHPELLDADAVVLAVPAPAARRLLVHVAPVASSAFARIELASMAVVAFAFPADVILPSSSGVLIASGELHSDGKPFTAKAFTFSSRKWAHKATGTHVLVRGSVGRYGDADVLRRDDADLITALRNDLAELTGMTATPMDALVTRWGGGLPQYGVGHRDVVDIIEQAVAQHSNLAVVGAALHGVGISACITSANATAERITKKYLNQSSTK